MKGSVGYDEHSHRDLYRGPKTSRASSLINEYGLSLPELQMAGDWAKLDSVKKYGKVEVATRKTLLEGKVLPLKKEREDADGYLS